MRGGIILAPPNSTFLKYSKYKYIQSNTRVLNVWPMLSRSKHMTNTQYSDYRFHRRNNVVYGEAYSTVTIQYLLGYAQKLRSILFKPFSIIRQIFQLWQHSTHSFPYTSRAHMILLYCLMRNFQTFFNPSQSIQPWKLW